VAKSKDGLPSTLGLENQLDKIKIKILITAACPSF
jgi:hypothetical protein